MFWNVTVIVSDGSATGYFLEADNIQEAIQQVEHKGKVVYAVRHDWIED